MYLNVVKTTGEWNVGGKLWEFLTQNQKDMLLKIRREGKGKIPNNEKNIPNNLQVVDTILQNLNKNNSRETNINTLSTSECNSLQQESSVSYIEYMIHNIRAEIQVKQAVNILENHHSDPKVQWGDFWS